MIKYFRFTWQQVLWEISFINLNLLLATIPVYESEEDKAKKKPAVAGKMEDVLNNIFKEQ